LKDHLTTIFDSITEFIALCDKDFNIIYSNKPADIVLGQGESLVGSTCFSKFRGKDERCVDCPLEPTVQDGHVIPLECYDERFGEYFEERTYPIIAENGEIEGFVLMSRNMTISKEINEKYTQSKKLAALGQISSGVAHDFNNVLTGVLGRVQILKKQTNDERILKNLSMIELAAQDGSATVKRMQDFARLRTDEKFIPLDVKEIVEEVLALTRPKWRDNAEMQGILIEPVVEIDEQLYVLGDASDLKGAFTNLIFNAVDAMPEGGVLTIRAEKKADKIVIEFEDTGIGMTDDTIERIYDPFFSTKGVKGTGLGMSEVYGVIKRHRGAIEATSKVGKGSKVIISLPSVKKGVSAEETDDILDTYESKILIIDDEEYILDMLEELLEDQGHKITTSSSTENGLKLFKNSNFDIVITDLGMPDMSGWEVAERVKKMNRAVSVILLTGWALNLEAEKIKENGVDFTLQKPFSEKDLYELIIDAKKLKDELSSGTIS